jgi:hypothetical protein
MDRYSVFVVAGLVAVGLGVGVVTGVRIKNLEIDLKPNRLGGALLMGLGVVAFAGGLLGAFGMFANSTDAKGAAAQSPPSPSPSTSPTANSVPMVIKTSGTSTTAGVDVALKLPVNKSRVSLAGTTVSGAVRGDLGDSTLWLFTWSDGAWYLDQQIDVAPDQSFQTQSGQLGVAADAGKAFTFGVFRADKTQTKAIGNAHRNAEGDVVLRQPPGVMMVSRVVVRN